MNLERLMELLNELSSVSKDSSKFTDTNSVVSTSDTAASSAAVLNVNTMKLADYYNTFMNEELIESKGIIVLFSVDC